METSEARAIAGGLALAVTWQAKPGEAARVGQILEKLAAAARQEPGCLLFRVHRDRDDDHRFLLYELYADEAALAEHQKTAHFQTLVLAEGIPLLAHRERRYLTPL